VGSIGVGVIDRIGGKSRIKMREAKCGGGGSVGVLRCGDVDLFA